MIDNSSLKAIIFDLGNVLIDFDYRQAARRVTQFTDKSEEEIYNFFFDSELTGLFEEGKISPQEFFLKIKEALNLRLEYEDFVSIWNDIFFLSQKNYAVYNLARALAKTYKIALLSNVNILHFEYLKKCFPVFDPFLYIITSYEIGVRKPHSLIYKKALERLTVLPGEAFYTDDRSELAQSARELGIRSFIFTDVEQLKKDLIRSGVTLNLTSP